MTKKLQAPAGVFGYRRQPKRPTWTVVVKRHVGRAILDIYDDWWAKFNACLDEVDGKGRRSIPTKEQFAEFREFVKKAHQELRLDVAGLDGVLRQHNLTTELFNAVKMLMADADKVKALPPDLIKKALNARKPGDESLDLTQKRDLRTVIKKAEEWLGLDMTEVIDLREHDLLTASQYRALKISVSEYLKIREQFQKALWSAVNDTAFRLRKEATSSYIRGSAVKEHESCTIGFMVPESLVSKVADKVNKIGADRHKIMSAAVEIGYKQITVEGLLEALPETRPSISLITQLALNMGLDAVHKFVKGPTSGRKDGRVKTVSTKSQKTGKATESRHTVL